MNILYDLQTFSMQKFGGISKYFYKLTNYNQNMWDFVISGKYSENEYVNKFSNISKFPITIDFRGKSRIEMCTNDFILKKDLKKNHYDLYHPTYYFAKNLPLNKPVIITAHDFIHEIYPEYFINDSNTVLNKKRILNASNGIIAISETTKKDLLRFYPEIDESKIHVVYHGIEWEKRDIVKDEQINGKYVLYTGTRNSYKNFTFFINAIAPILKSENFDLICTGGPFNNYEIQLLKECDIVDKVKSLYANEEQLRYLYENALCFIFPSLYEGFGLPILEAWVSKCPCLLAYSSCFPEIAGNAALYFDPKSVDSFRENLLKILQSNSLRKELENRGYERFDSFSIKSMITGTYEVYNSVINNF